MELTKEIVELWLDDRIAKNKARQHHDELSFGKYVSEEFSHEFRVSECGVNDMTYEDENAPKIQLWCKNDDSFYKIAQLIWTTVYEGSIDCFGKYIDDHDMMYFKYKGVIFFTYKKEAEEKVVEEQLRKIRIDREVE